MSDKKYNILFGQKDDDRINFFLYVVQTLNKTSEYKTEFTKKQPVFKNDAGTRNIPIYMRNDQFDSWKNTGAADNINSEWGIMIADIILWVYSDNEKETKKKLIIELHKSATNDKTSNDALLWLLVFWQ